MYTSFSLRLSIFRLFHRSSWPVGLDQVSHHTETLQVYVLRYSIFEKQFISDSFWRDYLKRCIDTKIMPTNLSRLQGSLEWNDREIFSNILCLKMNKIRNVPFTAVFVKWQLLCMMHSNCLICVYSHEDASCRNEQLTNTSSQIRCIQYCNTAILQYWTSNLQPSQPSTRKLKAMRGRNTGTWN